MTTTILSDPFTDDDGPVANHEAPLALVGTGNWSDWALVGSPSGGAAQISGNALIITVNDEGAVLNCGWSKQQTITINVYVAPGVDNRWSIIFRGSSSSTYYRLLCREPNGDVLLHAGLSILQSVPHTWAEGWNECVVELDKGDMRFLVNDVEVMTETGLAWDENRVYVGVARATGSSSTLFDDLTVTTEDQFALVASDSDDMVPQNQDNSFDGEHFWHFTASSNSLTCRYGTNPFALSETDVASGGGPLTDVANNGKCRSMIWGRLGGIRYVWSAISRTVAGDGWEWYRWQRSGSGLGPPTIVTVGDTTTVELMALGRNRSGDVSRLYGVRANYAGNVNTRYIDADMTGEAVSGAAFNPSNDFAESIGWYDVSDGYVYWSHDDEVDTFAVALERRKDNVGDDWGSEVDVGGAGAGEFEDVKRAVSFSHTGQHGQIRTPNGRIWSVYLNNADSTSGNYGFVVLRWREDSQEGEWTTVTLNAAGEEAIGITLTGYGNDLVLHWISAPGGSHSTQVKRSIYDLSEGTWSTPEVVWEGESSKATRIVAPERYESTVATCSIQDTADRAWLAWGDLPGQGGHRRRRLLIAGAA